MRLKYYLQWYFTSVFLAKKKVIAEAKTFFLSRMKKVTTLNEESKIYQSCKSEMKFPSKTRFLFL